MQEIEKILPHDRPMILIDKVLEINLEENYVVCDVNIHEKKIFFNKDINGISPLVGIEFMAQAIGCYAFFKSGENNPKIGFLLGARSYTNFLEKFENGKTYTIKAKEMYDDGELVSFECFIYNDDKEVANALINAFQPENAEEYIKWKRFW